MATARETALLTVAAIRAGRNKSTEFLFNERHAIFAFGGSTREEGHARRHLRNALKSGDPVKVALDSKRGLVQRVSAPSGREIEAFKSDYIPLEKPQRIVPINVVAIDPTHFNIVDHHLKWPVFKLCTRRSRTTPRPSRFSTSAPASRVICPDRRRCAVHPVPVRERRLLRPRPPDAPHHHEELSLLLREGVQLRHRRQ